MDYVTVSKLQSKLEGVANQATVRKLIKKMETDGFIESKGFGKLGEKKNKPKRLVKFIYFSLKRGNIFQVCLHSNH